MFGNMLEWEWVQRKPSPPKVQENDYPMKRDPILM